MSHWVILYILLYTLIWIGGVYDDIRSRREYSTIILEILSGLFVICFAFTYSYPQLTAILAPMVLPMLVVGFGWECHAGLRDIREFKQEQKQNPDNMEDQTFWLVLLSASLLFLISLPGYYMGFVVFTRL